MVDDPSRESRPNRWAANSAAAGLMICGIVAGPALGQETWVPDRTSGGKPDLQGVWDFRTLTPLQRPNRHGDRAVLSEEEAAAIEARSKERNERMAPMHRPCR